MDQMARSDDQRPAYILPDGWHSWPGKPNDIRLSITAHLYIYLVGVFARDGSLCRYRRPPFSAYRPFIGVGHSNLYGFQAAKDVRASHETLLDIFGRVEMFFRRLEMYTEVPLTTEMTEVIIEIMAEVLSVVGIATKEIKQGRASE